ncbi:MAG: hypothetical protein LBD88_03930 [Candidatus Peribacteria bacterium]|jgi:hypothetical protein|nr:hypothetical protein [Candidatus Peribacteria bacterium]
MDCIHKLNQVVATIQVSIVNDKLRATISIEDGNHSLKFSFSILKSGI